MPGDIKRELRQKADPAKAGILRGFFKTGRGEYGEGDIFLGVTVPEIRAISKRYEDIGEKPTEALLKSPIHEERLAALLVLVSKFGKADQSGRSRIFRIYLKNTAYINNWDLVDLTADRIVGEYLKDRNRGVLRKLARSKILWERRIAIIATFAFIKSGSARDTFDIAEMLIGDEHDLIHKAVGWMLREVGKRIDVSLEERFLDRHYRKMPRTMLRYAIERFPEDRRRAYLDGRR